MTGPSIDRMQELEARFVQWAARREDIRAALLIGSRARTDHPADPFSDMDIVVVATKPERYLGSREWLSELGTPWLTFVEQTATGGGRERRVLFAGEGGLDVDFSVFSVWRLRQLRLALKLRRWPALVRRLPGPLQREVTAGVDDFHAIIGRGNRVLLDKDRLLARILDAAGRVSVPPPGQPAAAEFEELCNDFWYHALWAAKKLARGELWMAKLSCDASMKWQLATLLRWQACARHGWTHDTWHTGRFLEEWADPRAVDELREAFAHYDRADIARALLVTMQLFRRVAQEVADELGYAAPSASERVQAMMRALLGEGR